MFSKKLLHKNILVTLKICRKPYMMQKRNAFYNKQLKVSV